MPLIRFDSLDDPRLIPYRNLKAANMKRHRELFVAEGTKLVERLIASDFTTDSVLLSEKRVPEWESRIPAEVPIYVVSEELGRDLVGFNFHVGVVAVGRRKRNPTLESVISKDAGTLTLVVLPWCDNPENLGAIIRISRGFGVDAMLLGHGCCDPFSRRVLRVSMGTAFKLPIIESRDLAADMQRLSEEWGVEFAATILDPDAAPLHEAQRSPRFGILFGNEHAGLAPEWIARCQQRLTIPMTGDTDSLNVAIAAGIFLHHFTRNLS
ncbi:MAG TPA: RNA methyltransferase [Planctomycetaceae bacterium]|nr:RNA methyltransferase [Planctomycetaceae bacterium]